MLNSGTLVDLARLQSFIAVKIKMPFIFGRSEDGNAVLVCFFPFTDKREIFGDAKGLRANINFTAVPDAIAVCVEKPLG